MKTSQPCRNRGLTLLVVVALMSLLSLSLVALTSQTRIDLVRTRRAVDGAQLREVLMAVAQRADALTRQGQPLPDSAGGWGIPAELEVDVVLTWREQTAERKVLAIEAVWPRSLARQVVTWERDGEGWRVSGVVLERGS